MQSKPSSLFSSVGWIFGCFESCSVFSLLNKFLCVAECHGSRRLGRASSKYCNFVSLFVSTNVVNGGNALATRIAGLWSSQKGSFPEFAFHKLYCSFLNKDFVLFARPLPCFLNLTHSSPFFKFILDSGWLSRPKGTFLLGKIHHRKKSLRRL